MSVANLFVLLLSLTSAAWAMPASPASPLLQKRSVTCRTVGASATATWTNSAGQTCTFTGIVGSNYGVNTAGGEYSCNGRCGAGCTGTALGNAYTQDCFSHDICSYFENASGGARSMGPNELTSSFSDANCGDAYDAAVDDTLWGFSNGCSQTNPSNAAVAPTTSPVCS